MTVAHTGALLDAADSDQAMAMLRAHGMRVSAARRLVIEALFATQEPVSAEQIAEGLGGRLPGSDIASVYRNLDTLERIGLVRHYHAGHGPGLYAPAAHDDREHLVCEVCGKATTVDADELEPARELIHERFGFEAHFSHFPIVGRCRHCAAENKPDNRR